MANEKAKGDYKHWVGAVPKIENWYKNFNFVLVESMEDLESIFKDKKDYYMAFDTETTGLDFEEIDLVGYSFCLDGKTAYYVPVYHFQYEGNLGEESVKFIYERMCEAKKVFMYNMRYDARIMEYYGYRENKADLDKRRWMYAKFDMSRVDYYDVSVPVWLADTNQKYPSLKWSSLHFLGIEQLHFDEVIENAGSFFYLNPSENEDTVFYAAADALCTFLLATATVKYFTEAKHSAKFDNLMLYPLLHYENERIWLDGDVLKNLYIIATDRVDKMERDVYAMIGGQINLNSPVQVAQAFERLGIDTGERTSKGTMSVGIKILADLPKEYVEKFPALKSYINYKKTAKLISSYIKPLLKEYERRGYCRFAYKTTEVPCLTEDNYVYIKGKGLISIKGVEVNDLIWTQYGYKKVLWNNKKWSDEIYRLTLKNGTQLIGTGHHPVLLNTSNNLSDLSLCWSGISSTTVGDTVVCNSHSIENEDTLVSLPSYVCEGRKEVTIPKVMGKKLARLVGFLDGDGCLLSDRVKLAFNTKESEIIEYYISLMSEVFNIESGKLYHSSNSNSSDCCFFSTDIVRFLKSINVRQKLSDTVSEYIKNSSYDIWVEYLCGLFDSDGCLLKSKDLFVPSVKGIKAGMIKDVHQMLLFLGINSSLHIRPSSGGNKTQYEIRVTGDRGRCYFRDIIGKNLVHNMRRDRAINNKVRAFYDIHVNNVASVEKCLNIGDYVYDIEVEDVHEYIANGIVTHNTGRLACGKDGKNSFFSPINAQCVVGSSELFTDRGVKTIKDISVGDNVWDGESFREVLNTYNNGIQDVYKVTLCDGKTLICTDKHQLYSSVVFSAFRELKDLNVGDSVAININSVDIGFSNNNLNTRISYDFDNVVGWVKIESIEYVGRKEVYDIHVDVTHRYCVNGFITHNSLPKPHVKMEDVFDLGDRNLFSKKDNIIMGYKFVYSSYDEEGKHIVPDDPTYIGWVEGMDDDLNIRMAISPKMLEDSGDDEFLYTSFDYAAEELRIAANLSREPNWVKAFTSGDDIHKSCYSLDTEFLTRDGWKTYEHIGIDTEIAQYNEDTKELEFVKAGHAYFNETDTMYHFVGNNTDLLVTPNHRMYDKGRDNWYVKRADELYKKRYYHTICSPISEKVLRDSNTIIDSGNIDIKSTYHKDGFSISVDDFVELLGYVITDGGTCLRSCGSKTVYFSQSDAKSDVLAKMKDLNKRLGGIFKEDIDYCKGKETTICGKKSVFSGNFHRFSLTSSALFDTVVEYIGGNLKKDRVLSSKMLQFSDRLLCKFLDAMYDGDGLHDNREGRENSRSLLVQSTKLVEQLQLILINMGYSTNIRDAFGRYSVNLYKLSYVKGKRVVRGSNRKTEIVKYDRPVKSVCFAVPSTLLFVRRNGRTSVCGNTACAIWGEEHYNRDYRKMAKYANFSILYGASSHSLYADSRYGFKSLQEAEDFYDKYKKALPTLFQWQDRLIYSARRKGMLQTFFGRPRRLRSYYENKQIGFANRSAGNTSVQGVAGDILKMVMIKLWRALFNNEEFKNDVAWRVAIHDEIGYTIRATKLMRILKIIKETQSVKLPEWPVEIITDPSVGWSMGRVYDFHMVEDESELGYHFEPDLA